MARKILFAALGLGAASVVALALIVGARAPDRVGAKAPDRDVREFQTEDYAIRVETVVSGLSHPWSLAFLPDGDMLVTERAGRLRRIHNGVLQPTSIAGTPVAHESPQEGLLDIALHPKFAQNHLVYLTYSKAGASGRTTVALARGWLDGDALTGTKDIFVSNMWSAMEGNMGSRLAFLSDGTLLMSTGERHERKPSQDPTSDGGKILHLRDDGSLPEMYSMGHRNPQGLAVHPVTGVIFEDEHGPMGGDELNVILPGRNYGWPIVTYGRNYDGTIITNETARPGLESPKHYWVPSIAPSGLAIYTGDTFPKWRDNVFVGGMADRDVGRQLYRVDLSTSPPHQESMLASLHHRIRDVRQGPDGLLYLLTDDGRDSLLRIEPVSR